MKNIIIIVIMILKIVMIGNVNANVVTLDFENTDTNLCDQFLSQYGVQFKSDGGCLSAYHLGSSDHAISGEYVIYSGSTPIDIQFFDPDNPSNPSVTDFVSVRSDLKPMPGTVTIKVFDVDGNLLDSFTTNDEVDDGNGGVTGGAILSISVTGIHTVQLFSTSGTVAFDDFSFNSVSPALTGYIDLDIDGIPDQWDKCPDTPADSWTDKNGCPASGLYTQEQVDSIIAALLLWGDIDGNKKIDLNEAIHALQVTSGVTQPAVK